MLNSKLELFDVPDVEQLAAGVIASSTLELSYHEREDLLAYLVATVWELSRRYEPAHGMAFGRWATITAKRRTIDWVRSYRGRSKWSFAGHCYERPRPQLLALDHRPNEADTSVSLGAGTSGESPLAWLLGERNRQGVGDLEQVDSNRPRRTSQRAAGAG